MKRRTLWGAAALCGLLVVGCGSATDKEGSNNGDNNGDNTGDNNGQTADPVATDCQPRCEARLEQCGAPSDSIEAACTLEICAQQPTQSEVTCLEKLSCEQLVLLEPEVNDPCGLWTDNSGGQNNGVQNNGQTNGGGSCTIGDEPRCEGDAVVTCRDLSGTPVKQTETCTVRCEDGACVEAWTLCTPKFSDGAGCADECNASGSITVNGNSYCTSRCGSNGECPSGTECDTSFNGGTCLPPCQSAMDCPEGFLAHCPESGFCGR